MEVNYVINVAEPLALQFFIKIAGATEGVVFMPRNPVQPSWLGQCRLLTWLQSSRTPIYF